MAAELEGTLDELLEELGAALRRHGLVLEGDRIVQGAKEVGRRTVWEPGVRAVFEWRAADWDEDAVGELEIRSEGGRLVVEQRGFGGAFWNAGDLVGWFAGEVAAPFLAAAAPAALGDWLTDRAARRPSGAAQRESYRDPTYHLPSFGAVLAALALGPEDRLLELGCGGGAFLARALATGCEAVGVDHSEQMLAVAEQANADAVQDGRLRLIDADVAHLPLEDEAFTAAATMQAFFFFADPLAALRECRRVLRPGGRVAIFTVSEEARGSPAMPEPMASRSRIYTDDELVALAREAGFDEAAVARPDLEPFARAAGLPEDALPLFSGPSQVGQLLVAR